MTGCYQVEIRVPHDHVVVLRVAADDAEAAKRLAVELFDAGNHQDPPEGVELLRDDFEESDEHLYAQVGVDDGRRPDASVQALREQAGMRLACRLLIRAFEGNAPDHALLRKAYEAAGAAV